MKPLQGFTGFFAPFAILLLSTSLLFSCSGRYNSTTDDNSDWASIDSLDLEPYEVEEIDTVVPDSVMPTRAKTTDEALAFMKSSPDSARYFSGILPRMAEDNIDYASRLLRSRYPYFIVVDKTSMYVVLFDRCGVELHAYKMACAKNYGTKHERRDSRTPEGFFSVEGIYDSTDWLFTDDDGVTSPVKGQFGPRFIRVKNPVSSQIGIHGTCAPWSLGGRRSHGCIRIHNDNIVKLVEYAEPGMPVIISPGPRDVAVNEDEGYDVPRIDIGKAKFHTYKLPPKPEATDSIKPATDSVVVVPAKTETFDQPDTTIIKDIFD